MDEMINKMDELKKVVKQYIKEADCGFFDTRNILGDEMRTVYKSEVFDVTIDVCFKHHYFEVFGLSYEEFEELGDYYLQLQDELRKDW